MSTIVLRGAKGEPLTHDEVDANFNNLNTDKYQSGDNIAAGTLTTTGEVGIGTDNPTALLTLSKDATVAGSANGMVQYCYGDTVRFQQFHANGTEASPTASLNGNVLYQFSTRGHTGSAFTAGVANIEMAAEDNFSTSTKARIGFKTHDGTSLTERMRVDSNGNVGLDVGNGDGYGITFNSTTHNAATTLDYYEEGTWTPILYELFENIEATASSSLGIYTRIGNVVTCSVEFSNIDTSGMVSGNTLYLKGLPFTSTSYQNCAYHVGHWTGIALPGTNPCGLSVSVLLSSTNARFPVPQLSGGSTTYLQVGDLTSGVADLAFTFTYFTNT
jgi:hypothetical protein